MSEKRLTKQNDPNFEMHEAMADAAERGEYQSAEPMLRGTEALQYLRELMGRPGQRSLGETAQGRSPLWQVRVPFEVDEAAKDFLTSFGGTKSELLRAALVEFLAVHKHSA